MRMCDYCGHFINHNVLGDEQRTSIVAFVTKEPTVDTRHVGDVDLHPVCLSSWVEELRGRHEADEAAPVSVGHVSPRDARLIARSTGYLGEGVIIPSETQEEGPTLGS